MKDAGEENGTQKPENVTDIMQIIQSSPKESFQKQREAPERPSLDITLLQGMDLGDQAEGWLTQDILLQLHSLMKVLNKEPQM